MTGPSVCHNLSLILEDLHGGKKKNVCEGKL